MTRLLAYQLGNLSGVGPLGANQLHIASACLDFTSVLSTTISVLTVLGGLWFIVQFFTAAVQWISAGGDKQALENVKKRMLNAIIGLLILVLAYSLIVIIAMVFGFEILSPCRVLKVPGLP